MTSKTVQFPTASNIKKSNSMLGEFKSEMRKLTWPARDEVIRGTKAVLASLFVFGLGIYVVDLAIRGALNLIQTAVNVLFR
ncbi:MAG: preprotein translocase subunit SecE [Chlamydiae bacterium]|nr:preprotein translocase subunit SecE [Chlamydiota bacterium]